MAEVLIEIGGRGHAIGCRDGEEERLRQLGAMVDQRWPVAQRAAGNAGAERAMLLIALMLADELDEATTRPAVKASGPAIDDAALARVAERLERLAETLERPAVSA